MTTVEMPPARSVPEHTGSRLTRALGGAVLVTWTLWLLWGLVLSPADVVQHESVRLFYLHVPMAIMSSVTFSITLIGSIMVLRNGSVFWDLMAGVAAEIGVMFLGLVIATGAVWGKPTWGTYWEWDPRLTTAALMFLVYLGYLVIRRLDMDPVVRARRAAVFGIVAFINVPLTRFSVQIWNSLHQETTISLTDTQMDGAQLTSYALGMLAMATFLAWLLVHRFRVAWLEHAMDESGLEKLIRDRRAEGAANEPGGVR